MPDRDLVSIFASRQDAAVARILSDSGWHVEALDVLKPQHVVDGTRSNIGIVQLDDEEWLAPLLARVEQLGRVSWIAVVNRALLANDGLREFIATHCVDYQTTPLGRERLLFALGHVAGMAALAARCRADNAQDALRSSLVGDAAVIQKLRTDVRKIAAADAPVLITGESGTGKELVARAIHLQSRRRSQPFVAVNCVSLSPSLIHAELFGHERGSFTGAHRQKRGQFELAHGGTILLDEIGDLHLELQSSLLRFLEEYLVRRVGGEDQIRVNVRVVAATNIDLEAAVRAGRFRQDLFYRLNVLRISTPPLREHRADIEVMPRVILERIADRQHARAAGFSRSALAALRAHDWPGNVRELVNRVHRACVMCEGKLISPTDLQLHSVDHSPALRLEAAIARAERETLVAALQRTGGNATQAAQVVGVSRATLYRLMERHAAVLPCVAPVELAETPLPVSH